MLQIKNISKKYVTGDLTQTALDQVSFNLRDNEFVAILGPSGSGKTTLLNVIGGLDRYDSGDLIINGISTQKYSDRDWDSYRNHTIGFVFQSYNLIPHQSILANVELALTISGQSRSQRRQKARQALEQVGLGSQLHKRPNQLSGGQMQRVAIARALVNDPDILLADEPTGALDSETSVQVMDLLKAVARDRLVVLVTHNNELAQAYANRIIHIKDGQIEGDSHPYNPDTSPPPQHKNLGHASMSFLTALSLSFNNLKTKKGRTLLTAFAGSIGIIGISLILSLSNGASTYISDIQKDTMVSYPITISAQTLDLSSLIETSQQEANGEASHALDAVYPDTTRIDMASEASSSLTQNNLTAFKAFLDEPDSPMTQYLGQNGVVYGYETDFGLYTYDPEDTLVDVNGVTIGSSQSTSAISSSSDSGSSQAGSSAMASSMAEMRSAMGMTDSPYSELLPGQDGALISPVLEEKYDLLYGSWPQSYNEVVLVLNNNNEIQLTAMYELGLLPASDYQDMLQRLNQGEAVNTSAVGKLSYADAAAQTLYLIPASDQYEKNADGTYRYIGTDSASLAALTSDALQLKISGIIRPVSDSSTLITTPIGYTSALTDYLIDYANQSDIVQAQQASPDINVLNGLQFAPQDDSQKASDAEVYLQNLNVSEKAAVATQLLKAAYANDQDTLNSLLAQSEADLAAWLDQQLEAGMDQTVLVNIYEQYISAGTYDDNMSAFGVVSRNAPSSISLYADKFEDKDGITATIDQYNQSAAQADQITYTDYVGLLMSSVTTIINVISYVLIAFVAVSLIVSSIMIGIITYISVLERTKEIGILRAIGASRRNISQVFSAETLIIGLTAGLMGVGLSLLALLPINALVHHLTGITTVNALLPLGAAGILVLLSMLLTLIAGIFPSRTAAKKDPVIALRSE
ncbi:MAG: ABC transporter ATP-binding protein/permease [Oscillospiraceae bacterium]|nr:ABC transporter ATP-binding protein/permease [Oscillospiraceae bacterium]MDD4368913.1 ABC transporter ATP-binding protein/permease [Oscillospiraceae bacterium]